MASISGAFRAALHEKLRAASHGGKFEIRPEVLLLKKFQANELENLVANVAYLIVAPGERVAVVANRTEVERRLSAALFVVKKLHRDNFDADFDECEQLVEQVEAWLVDRDNDCPTPNSTFDELQDIPTTREAFSAEYLQNPTPAFVAMIQPQYLIV